MEQYLIYLRKSRADMEAEARGEGETLARHEHALLEFAKCQHLNITQIYKEIVSGDTIAARPVMQKLLTEVEQGLWSGVLVMEIERLARGDTIDQGIVAQTFKFSETKIITPMKTYDPNNEFDEEYFEFGLFMARREYKTINRRLQRGRLASVKEGKYVASIAPFGYKRIKLQNDKGYSLAVVPENAQIVTQIFSWYVYGIDENGGKRRLGIQKIARMLNELKVPPIRHDYWQKETIRDILINPVYIGKVRWNWRPVKSKMVDGKTQKERPRNYDEDCVLADGLHDAIIDKEVFELAQEYISNAPPCPVGYKNELINPLAGIIICGKCGRSMVFRKGYSKPDYIVCHARACNNVSAPFQLVEKRLLESLRQWIDNYELKWKSKAKQIPINSHIIEKSLKKAQNDIDILEKQLSTTYDLLEQGIYSKDQFLERSRVLSARIDDAKKGYANIESEWETANQRYKTQTTIIPKVEHLLEVYATLETPAQKNNLLKGILEKVVYTKNVNGCYRGVSAGDFSLDLYPKLPSSKE